MPERTRRRPRLPSLRSLTLRGRAFLAAGLTTVGCGVVLGETTLVQIGALALALPLIAVLVVGRSRYRLGLTRTLSPAVLPAGHTAEVTLRLTNEGRAPGGVLLLEDRIPYPLGNPPRFVIDGVSRGWSRQVTYPVRADTRGRYPVGPMSVRVRDPFGLTELGRSFTSTSSLLVTPPVDELTPIPLTGSDTGAGDSRTKSFANGSAEDVTIRDYRRGDDLRRVHWPSSARTGELMVRREEQPWHARAVVLVDNRAHCHRGQGAASSFETAVRVAASVGEHLRRRGFAVHLADTEGRSDDRATDRDTLLQALAMMTQSGSATLDLAVDSVLAGEGDGGLLVGVFGRLSPDDSGALKRLRHGVDGALAASLDVDRWGQDVRRDAHADAGPSAATVMLSSHRWRVTSLGPEDRIDDAWQRLSRSRAGVA